MKPHIISAVFLIAFFAILSTYAQTAAGSLDTAFGAGGKVTTDFFGGFDRIFAVAVQPDGKIVVAGNAQNGTTTDFALARYNTNGSLDTTFDADGKVTTDFAASGDTVFALVIQPDGKIVAGGNARIGSTTNFALARYNADGSLDASFDTDGKVTTDFQNDFDQIESIALQADGKIVAAGVTFVQGGASNFGLARYNSDGSLDQTFGTGGTISTDFNLDSDWAFAVAIQTDGKIVAGGKAQTSTSNDFALARYNSNGSLDATFDGDGKVTTDFLQDSDEVSAVLIQPDGKIVATGIASLFTEGTQIDFGVARYNTNGSLDTTFDTDGKASADFGGDFDEGFAAALQPDGKIIVAGGARPPKMGSTVNFGLARFNQNGSLDTAFDADGKVLTQFNSLDQANAVALQADGKIIAAGSTIGNNVQDFALVRYLGNSAAVRNRKYDFDGDGKADLSVFRPDNGAWYVQQSSSGFMGVQFGVSTDKLVAADYDGDGKTDVAVYRAGTWYLQRSTTGFLGIAFGASDDVPQPADYDNDGKAELTVFRPSNGTWYFYNLANNQTSSIQFGQAGDKPVAADYDADGKTDIAVFRSGTWYLQRSTLGFVGIQFGEATDKPVAADYDGDGKADIAVFRPSNGNWYLQRSQLGFTGTQFGVSTDSPVPADYDGDGKADVAVFRDGTWYLQRSQAGFTGIQFGAPTDKPAPNSFIQ